MHFDHVRSYEKKVCYKYNFNGQVEILESFPANRRHRPNVSPMLGHRLRRWPNNGSMSRVCQEWVWMSLPTLAQKSERYSTIVCPTVEMGQNES